MLKAKFSLFQIQFEQIFWNPLEFCQPMFGVVPKAFNVIVIVPIVF